MKEMPLIHALISSSVGRTLASTRLAWIAAVFALGMTGPGRAQIIVSAPTVSAAPGSTGAFDVLITDSGGSFHVATSTLGLSVTGPVGIHFTGVTINTAPP